MTEATLLTTRALLLDMDGTLVNSDAAVERVWRGWAAEHGVDPERAIRLGRGRQGYATMATLLPDRPLAENLTDNRRLLAQEVEDTEGVVPIPGAPEFLDAIATAPHALVTSASLALAEARMGAAGLAVPELRITAESVGASKPDPEGFLKAAAELGFAPADCLVLEDSVAGVSAARAAGMPVLGIGAHLADSAPTARVPDLTAVGVELLPDGRVRLRLAPHHG
ncbi:HAD-IA family hydrolase [Streptomyces sp. XM4193]|uniref:HAD-IA family hydrolase n=1 Tax=Streptomyces sp. XM4193 TaxID=2929782 RepID=UPI001FF75949|nr:HAD-IA family hydrolase [Streptomyces sp. XM4193]MCK1796115.1 HAD-IA family hydrolase [Streptomyces sp. XM4193]